MQPTFSTHQAFCRCPCSIIAPVTRLISRSKASVHDHSTSSKWECKWRHPVHGWCRFSLWVNLCFHVISRRNEHVICLPSFITSDVKFDLYQAKNIKALLGYFVDQILELLVLFSNNNHLQSFLLPATLRSLFLTTLLPKLSFRP